MPRISQPEREAGEAEGEEVLKGVRETRHRPFTRRNDGQNHQNKNNAPACRSQILRQHHNFVELIAVDLIAISRFQIYGAQMLWLAMSMRF